MHNKIITATNLQEYFFSMLDIVNQKILSPLPMPILHYSSLVLDKYSKTSNYFSEVDGKISEKILGIKFLEAGLDAKNASAKFQDVADSSLMICGYFASHNSHKIVSLDYYQKLGQTAYMELSHLGVDYFDGKNIYEMMAMHFNKITHLFSLISDTSTHAHLDENSARLFITNKAS